jgi:hypothetical protein
MEKTYDIVERMLRNSSVLPPARSQSYYFDEDYPKPVLEY